MSSATRQAIALLGLTLTACDASPEPPPGGWANTAPTVVEQVVDQGIATHAEVNQIMTDCFNWPVGPFAMVKGATEGWKE